MNSVSGCLTFQQVLNAGDSTHRKLINHKSIKPSDPVNIQYTSVKKVFKDILNK